MKNITVGASKEGIGGTGWTKAGAIKVFENQVDEIDGYINTLNDREHRRLFRIYSGLAKKAKKNVKDKLLVDSEPVPSLPADDYTAGLFNISGWYRDLVLLLKDVKPLTMAAIIRKRFENGRRPATAKLCKEVRNYQKDNCQPLSKESSIRTFKSKHLKELEEQK